jgi:hypothetical protein
MRLVAAARILDKYFSFLKKWRVTACEHIGKSNHLIAAMAPGLCLLCQ